MQQETNNATYGTQLYKVKYRTVELQTAPAFTATSLGTLKRGAVVTILDDSNPYHYQVRLDNGLEGYVYKAAGEITSGLNPTPMPQTNLKLSETPDGAVSPKSGPNNPSNGIVSSNGTSNGTVSSNGNGLSNDFFTAPGSTEYLIKEKNGRSNGTRRGLDRYNSPRHSNNGNGSVSENGTLTFGNLSSGRNNDRASSVKITTSEIAALDTPGIVGRQVAKLRRGDIVSVLKEDSFFYEVALPNGQSGFIPRYAGEAVH